MKKDPKSFISCARMFIFSLISFVNIIGVILLGKKLHSKLLSLIGYGTAGAFVIGCIFMGISENSPSLSFFGNIAIPLLVMPLFFPSVFIIANLKDYKAVLDLEYSKSVLNIDYSSLKETDASVVNTIPWYNSTYGLAAERLYGSKSVALLNEINIRSQQIEAEKKEKEQREKLEQEKQARQEEERITALKLELAREEARKAEAMVALEKEKTMQDMAKKDHSAVASELIATVPASEKTKEFSEDQSVEPTAKTDINTCTEEQLAQIKEIGPILAKKAIVLRREKGQFDSVYDFLDALSVNGFKRETLLKILSCSNSQSNGTKGRRVDI